MISAALLDKDWVYLRMDELTDPADLTLRHLPQISECDLPSGEYKWLPDAANPYGGAFWPLKWLARVERDRLAVQEAEQAAARLSARRAARKVERLAAEAKEAAKQGER